MASAMKKEHYALSWEDVEVFVMEKALGTKKAAEQWEKAYVSALHSRHPSGYNHWLVCGNPGSSSKNWAGILKSTKLLNQERRRLGANLHLVGNAAARVAPGDRREPRS